MSIVGSSSMPWDWTRIRLIPLLGYPLMSNAVLLWAVENCVVKYQNLPFGPKTEFF